MIKTFKHTLNMTWTNWFIILLIKIKPAPSLPNPIHICESQSIKHSNSDATFISSFKIIQSNQVHTGKQMAIEREVLWVLVTQGAVSNWRKVEELDQISCHIDVDICTLKK